MPRFKRGGADGGVRSDGKASAMKAQRKTAESTLDVSRAGGFVQGGEPIKGHIKRVQGPSGSWRGSAPGRRRQSN
ncbi:hypothetical protein WCLP8_2720005 [uncultured Gammaproteobacteria bacterium]